MSNAAVDVTELPPEPGPMEWARDYCDEALLTVASLQAGDYVKLSDVRDVLLDLRGKFLEKSQTIA